MMGHNVDGVMEADTPTYPGIVRRIMILRIVLAVAAMPLTLGALQRQATQPAEKSAQAEKAPPFRWIESAGETAGMRLETRKLAKISLLGQTGSAAEAEKETVPLGESGTRTTIRVYDSDANGNRTLVETVVEEVRNLPGSRTQAVRTVSRRDANNRMPIVRKDTQETSPAGTNGFQTRLTVYLPGSSGALVPAEQVTQDEKAKTQDEIEIDRIRMVLSVGGRWQPEERRVNSVRKASGQTSGDEIVYRYDPNGRVQIDQRNTSREWQDGQGRDSREISSYRSDPSGRLNLQSRTRISSESRADGTRQTTQVTEEQNPAAPSGGLRPIERVTELSRPSGRSGSEREVHVQTPDPNGVMRTAYFQRTSEIK